MARGHLTEAPGCWSRHKLPPENVPKEDSEQARVVGQVRENPTPGAWFTPSPALTIAPCFTAVSPLTHFTDEDIEAYRGHLSQGQDPEGWRFCCHGWNHSLVTEEETETQSDGVARSTLGKPGACSRLLTRLTSSSILNCLLLSV